MADRVSDRKAELEAERRRIEAELVSLREDEFDKAAEERKAWLEAGPPKTAPTGLVRFVLVPGQLAGYPDAHIKQQFEVVNRLPEVHYLGVNPMTAEVGYDEQELVVADREVDRPTLEWLFERFNSFDDDGEDRPRKDGPFFDDEWVLGVVFDGKGTRTTSLSVKALEPIRRRS